VDVPIPFTRDEIVLRQRYEVLSLVNDLLVAIWFVVGSVLFFSPDTTRAGTWCFLLGSIQLAVRPAIRLTRQVHLRRVAPAHRHESLQDF
jgi:hypothetical protein